MGLIKKFVRGHLERGNEVIVSLEKLGGVNKHCHTGNNSELLYFIEPKTNYISCCSPRSKESQSRALCQFILECWEEIRLSDTFMDGDIVIIDKKGYHPFIYAGKNDRFYKCHCGMSWNTGNLHPSYNHQWSDVKDPLRYATSEEAQKLFNIINKEGYIWDSKNKKLCRKMTFTTQEPAPVYWFKVPEDPTERYAYLEQLKELSRINAEQPIMCSGYIVFNEKDSISCVQPNNKLGRAIMLFGKEIKKR